MSYSISALEKHGDKFIDCSTLSENKTVSTPLSTQTQEIHEISLQILNHMPSYIVYSLGGKEGVDELPCLDVGQRVGDYIDFFEPAEMEHPVMKGVDQIGRPFIAFKILLTNDKINRIFTLFQRHAKKDVWVGCFCHPHPNYREDIEKHFGFGSGPVDQIRFGSSIIELLDGRSVAVRPDIHVELAL